MTKLRHALREAQETDYDWTDFVAFLSEEGHRVKQVIQNTQFGSLKSFVEGVKIEESADFLIVQGRNLKATLNKKGFMNATLVKKELGAYYSSLNVLFVLA